MECCLRYQVHERSIRFSKGFPAKVSTFGQTHAAEDALLVVEGFKNGNPDEDPYRIRHKGC